MDSKFGLLFQNTYFRLSVLVVGAVLSTAVFCLSLHRAWSHREMLAFYAGLLLVSIVLYQIWGTNRVNARKLNLMLEAVRNDDFSFRFPLRHLSHYDQQLNDSLNQMNQMLLEAKRSTIEREQYYDIILETVTTGIVVLDANGFVVRCNQAALHLLGLSSFSVVHQLSSVSQALKSAFVCMKAGEKLHVSYQTPHEDVHLMLRCSLVELKNKQIRIIAFNNIKSEMDEKEMESWIRLTRVLTHEIMNSIAPINSLSDTLLHLVCAGDDSLTQWQENRKKLQEGLNVIEATSHGLMSFVDSYRKFSSLQKPVPQLVFVRELLEHVQQLQLYAKQVKWSANVSPDDLIIYVDESLIRQVLLNLVKNAIQAHAQHISIQSYCLEDESVVIEISNDGDSIPEEEAEQIFVPFFTTKTDGSGIGLSVSRQIMKLSGGSISLRRKPITGYQTTFVLQFN